MFNDRWNFAQSASVFAPEGNEGAAPVSGTGSASPPSPAGNTTSPSSPSGAASTTSQTAAKESSGAPSAVPGSAPASSPGTEVSAPDDPFNFGSEDSWFGAEETIPAQPDTAAAVAAEQPTVAATTGAEPVAKQTSEVAPQATPTAPGPQEAQPQGLAVQAPLSPGEPGKLAEALQANEAALIESVAQRYALSDEEREALETDVVGTVPKLLAKLHVRLMTNVLNQMAQSVPQMVERQMRVSKANAQNADKFYTRWPDIKKDQHGETVNRLGALYRQMNPDAPMEQMIEELGPLVMLQAKITPSPKPIVTTNGSVAGAPRAPQPSPFVPAGGGVTAIPQQTEPNPWGAEAFFGPEN